MTELAESSNTFLSWVVLGSKVVGTLIVGLGLMLYTNQDRLLYFPNPPGIPPTPDENPDGCKSPAEWTVQGRHLSHYESSPPGTIPFIEEFLETPDGCRIHTWLMLQPELDTDAENADSSQYPTLIYFHGNAGNMGFRLINAVEMYSLVKMNILMMDYRGYGKSTGRPNEEGLQLDGETVLRYAAHHPKLKNSPIILFGRSLGGAVAFYLANKFPALVSAIMVENTFLSISSMVDVVLPFVKWLKPLVLNIKWHSDEKIKTVPHPILFISGDADELVPPSHMKQLYTLASKSKHREFFTVFGGHHNDTWERAGREYYKKMLHFVEDWVLPTPPSQPEEDSSSSASSSLNSIAGTGNDIEEKECENLTRSPNMVEDEDYLVLSKSINLPTMDKHFHVHQ